MASSYLYSLIIDKTLATKDQDHLDILLYSHASLLDRTQAILEGKQDEMREALKKDLLFLEECGCSHLVVACNIAHTFLEDTSFLNSKFFNMVEISVEKVSKMKGIKRVGLMSTTGTLISGIYQKTFEKKGIEVITPGEEDQESLMTFIYDIKAGKPVEEKVFFDIYKKLLQESDIILTTCTELSVHVAHHIYENLLDALEITTDKILKDLKVPLREGISHGHL